MPMRTALRKVIRRVCAMMIALALVFVCLYTCPAPARAESDGMIRVKLTRIGAPNAIKLSADCDYYLAADPTVRVPAGQELTVSADGSTLELRFGKQRVSLEDGARLMRSRAGDAGLRFIQPELSNRFCGDLGLTASDGVISAILNIYIENYLYGVVGYEMSPSSGVEALKAQAVAARTYALRKKATRSGSAYDVTDTTADQVFKGYSSASEYANVVKAVDATRGGVLYYGSSLAQCYYCASNGGQTESSRNAWGTTLEYTPVKDDSYDLASGAAVKTAEINRDLSGIDAPLKTALAEGVKARLAEKGLGTSPSDVRVNYIESITACDSRFAAPSRLYKSLTFKLNVTARDEGGATRTGTVSVGIPTYGVFEKWYDLSINDEDNETVWVAETERGFAVSFRRSGHGVGMSQRGAQVMAGKYGRKLAEILDFYYPGTQGRQLELTDTTRDMKAVEPQSDQSVIATARLTDQTDLLNAAGDSGVATATVAAGAVVDVYAVQGEWAAVGFGGKYGFVSTDSLASFTLAGATVVRAEGTVYAVVGADATVRQLPVDHAEPIASVAAGSSIQVYAWTEDWAMVESTEGLMGFVPASVLDWSDDGEAAVALPGADEAQEVSPAAELYAQLKRDSYLYLSHSPLAGEAAALYRGSVVKVLEYGGDWARVAAQDGEEGYIALADIQAVEAGGDQQEGIVKVEGTLYLYVQAEQAALYKGHSDDTRVLARLSRGEKVRVGAYNADWACVRVRGVTGYMRMDALGESRPVEVEGGAITKARSGAYAFAARNGVTVYESYDTASTRLAELAEGERVAVGAYNDAWALVRAGNVTGYVRREDLRTE